MRQTLISHPLRAQLTSDDIDPFTVVTKQIFAEKGHPFRLWVNPRIFFAQEDKRHHQMKNL